MYYNTNNETGETLKNSWQTASSQELKIKKYFIENKDAKLHPHQILQIVFNNEAEITSVRRALTDLTKDGFLNVSQDMVMGFKGKRVHTWELNTNN